MCSKIKSLPFRNFCFDKVFIYHLDSIRVMFSNGYPTKLNVKATQICSPCIYM